MEHIDHPKVKTSGVIQECAEESDALILEQPQTFPPQITKHA